jgi:acyl-CoA thioesterase FadM
LEKLLKKNCYPFVISTTINYKKQVKIFEQCKGKIILDRINHSIWDLKTTFKVNNKITAHAVQKCVFVDLLTNEIQNLHFNEIVQ